MDHVKVLSKKMEHARMIETGMDRCADGEHII
jgi:hypothetical protein